MKKNKNGKPAQRDADSRAQKAKAKAKGVPAASRALGAAGAEVCPVVGFGASAGGLEAFTDVLEHLSTDTGFALVFVQHLDPKHASILTELLKRSTKLPVSEVKEAIVLEPNHVFVIPPNAELLVKGNHLHLVSRPTGRHLPIDTFFRSLAEDRGERAIGIILSGTASDGTLGLQAIKAAGGITFAQDPVSAKYDGMPLSAIGTGCVDFVLPPRKIAEELRQLHRHPYLVPTRAPVEPASPQEEEPFAEIVNQLRAMSGVDFGLYKPGTIHRRVIRRMALRKMENTRDYAKVLKQDRAELSQLYQDVLINVTGFFREPVTFDALRTRILPLITKSRNNGESIRVWVPGCATGEEAYSIAICLLEYMRETGKEMPIQIFGTDLSEPALQRARAGIYPETIAVDISPESLRRFFVRVNSSYQIARSVRDTCIFARQNITKDPPFSKLDLILCRNVLIYLGPALQANAMRLFHYALRPDGFLVLGLSESTGAAADLFTLTDNKLKIYTKKPGPTVATMDLAAYQEPKYIADQRYLAEVPVELNILRKVDQMLLSRYSPPAVIVDKMLRILQFRGRTAPYLEHPPGSANLDLLRLTPSNLGLEIQKLVRKAEAKGVTVRSKALTISSHNEVRTVTVAASPIQLPRGSEPQFLVAIEEVPAPDKKNTAKKAGKGDTRHPGLTQRIRDLEQELATTRESLQGVIEEQEASSEELKSANEEVQSGNEELQSTNEELLTAKEELQSTSEELTTVNEEMQGRNLELSQVNNDLLNLLSSVNIPTLMLGNDLRIRRFTPQAEKLFNLLSTDIGRPVSDLRLKINMADLVGLCKEVRDELSPIEREVLDADGRYYSMWVRPYRTSENRIDGVVLSLFDVTEQKQLAEARYRRLFDAAIDGIVIADATTGEIVDVNPSTVRLSGYGRNQLVGTRFWESPLFINSGLDEHLLEYLRERESLQRSLPINLSSGRALKVEIACNAYAEGERRVIQFNIRNAAALE